jgi:hypothetical protein
VNETCEKKETNTIFTHVTYNSTACSNDTVQNTDNIFVLDLPSGFLALLDTANFSFLTSSMELSTAREIPSCLDTR